MMFRQDLPGFGEPREGHWDGFQRITTANDSGGIIGVFRHRAEETQRQVFVNYLDPERKYTVLKGPEGKKVGTWTVQELQETGFSVTLDKEYAGALFEIKGL